MQEDKLDQEQCELILNLIKTKQIRNEEEYLNEDIFRGIQQFLHQLPAQQENIPLLKILITVYGIYILPFLLPFYHRIPPEPTPSFKDGLRMLAGIAKNQINDAHIIELNFLFEHGIKEKEKKKQLSEEEEEFINRIQQLSARNRELKETSLSPTTIEEYEREVEVLKHEYDSFSPISRAKAVIEFVRIPSFELEMLNQSRVRQSQEDLPKMKEQVCLFLNHQGGMFTISRSNAKWMQEVEDSIYPSMKEFYSLSSLGEKVQICVKRGVRDNIYSYKDKNSEYFPVYKDKKVIHASGRELVEILRERLTPKEEGLFYLTGINSNQIETLFKSKQVERAYIKEKSNKELLVRCCQEDVVKMRSLLMKVADKYSDKGVKVNDITSKIKAENIEKASEQLKIPHRKEKNLLVFGSKEDSFEAFQQLKDDEATFME